MDTVSRLRALIGEMGWSQAEVAYELGISERSVRRYLKSGSDEPPAHIVLALERLHCKECGGCQSNTRSI